MLVDGFGVDGCAVWRKPHQLVLAAVDLEAAMVREGRVEEPERMRKLEMLSHFELVAASDAPSCRGPLADPVERQYGGFVKWAREERAGSVALVVVHEQQRRFRLLRQAIADH